MLKYFKRIIDAIRLITQIPGAYIFFRREYDKFFPILRWIGWLYRRIWLRKLRLIVVVGSLGKTTTRRAVHCAMDAPERGFSYSNYGSALAINLLLVKPGDSYAVIEAGISSSGWMRVYSRFLKPDIVVVTSIKSDHFRSFPTLEHTREAKVDMVRRLSQRQVVFLNGDDPNVRWMATQTKAQVVTYGFGQNNDFRATQVQAGADGVVFNTEWGNRSIPITSKLIGKHMVYSLLAAIGIAEWEGKDLPEVVRRLESLQAKNSRLELVQLPGEIRILDDSTKGGLDTIQTALDTLTSLPAKRRLVLFGGVEDPPGKARQIDKQVAESIVRSADRLYYLGHRRKNTITTVAQRHGLPAVNLYTGGPWLTETVETLKRELHAGDLLLIKGRSTQRLRRVVLALMGLDVSCQVTYCGVKSVSCDVCPLLTAPSKVFTNYFIARYTRT